MKKIITDEHRAKIIELALKGKTNKIIAEECNMKLSTLLYWKKKIRINGIDLPALLGRPLGVPTEKELENARKILK